MTVADNHSDAGNTDTVLLDACVVFEQKCDPTPAPTLFWCTINTSGWVHVTLCGCDWTLESHALNTMLICVCLPEEPLGDHAEAQSCLCGVHPHNHIVLNWAHQVKCLLPSPGTWTSEFYLAWQHHDRCVATTKLLKTSRVQIQSAIHLEL